MAQSTGMTSYRRKEITYFDGLNSIVANNIAKKEELMHCENIRSPFIGTIEKREGMSQMGDTQTITANHGVFFFSNSGTNNTGVFKSSRISATNTLYYLNSNTNAWTALTGKGTQATGYASPVDTFDSAIAEDNLYLVDRNLIPRYIQGGTIGNTVITSETNITFNGSGANDISIAYSGDISTNVSTLFIQVNGTGSPNTFVWNINQGDLSSTTNMTTSYQALYNIGYGIGTVTTSAGSGVVTGVGTSFTTAFKVGIGEQIVVGGEIRTISSITSDTVLTTDNWTGAFPNTAYTIKVPTGFSVKWTSATGHTGSDSWTYAPSGGNLFRAPNSSLVNYYKGKLYLADLINNGTSNRQKNTILRSSPLVGILALANEDAPAGIGLLKVTDTKYILPGEALDIRRGGVRIGLATVISVQETSINIVPINVNINSADELWVLGTFNNISPKVFRWAINSAYGGVLVKDYDTFRLSGTSDGGTEEIKMMTNVGNVMMIGSNSNLGIWNDLTLRTLDTGIGCVSRKGVVKALGSLFFMHYTGVYQTEGDMPQLISTKIERYIAGASKSGLEGCVAGKKGRNIFFAIGDVTLRNADGSVEKILHDVCLEYSIIQKNWYIHTNVKATSMTTYISSTDTERLLMASTFLNDPVVEFLSTGIFTDFGGTEIQMRADTPSMLLGELFEKISYALEAIIEMERGNGLKVFISLDLGGWYEIKGEAEKGLTILKLIKNDMENESPARCRNIRISLRHNGKSLCKVSKLAINYMISAEEEVDKEEATRALPNLA